MKTWCKTCLPGIACVLLSGCFEQDSPSRSTVLPLDYQASFVQVGACRRSTAGTVHKDYMLVRASPHTVSPYSDRSQPLPAGSTLVAEEYSDPSCRVLEGLSVMFKEQPGYDAQAGDWHWQRLDSLQSVREDGRVQKCASCHAACSGRDFTCSP